MYRSVYCALSSSFTSAFTPRASLFAFKRPAFNMSKRTIHDFFKKDEAPVKAAATANKKAKADPPADLAPADPPRAPADAAAAAAVSPSDSAAAAASAGPPSAGVGDAAAGGAGVADGAPAALITDEQRLRAESNRAIALAKQHVKLAQDRAQQAALQGARPQLKELLVEPGWSEVLGGEFEKPYFAKLQTFIEGEWSSSAKVFPPPSSVFRAFNATAFSRIKVVIIGQDPYHDVGQAMGLCFSVPQGIKTPSSLVNIYKELKSDLGLPVPQHGNLEKWAQQGVFLLNTVLTVRAHQANSHSKKGWETFTDAAIRAVSASAPPGVVFLLWGKQAQDKASLIDKARHHVLTAPHPSGLSAHKGFFGCKHFSQCNEILRKEGKLPIDWRVD